MATQKELADILNNEVVPQIKKVNSEIGEVQSAVTAANARIVDLEKIIAEMGTNASQELVDAVAAVKAEVQLADEKIPDSVPIPAV